MALQPTCSSSPGEAAGGKAEENVVHKILDKRLMNGKEQYQVMWEAEVTWEPKEQLTNCPKLLAAFEKLLEEKQTSRKGQKKGMVPEYFDAEIIVDKRIRRGRPEYLVQWKGYGEEMNTWEPAANFESPVLVEDYEEKTMSLKKGMGQKKKPTKKGMAGHSSSSMNGPALKEQEEVTGFDRGLAPEKILGARDSTGELLYLVKWKGTEETDFVAADEAKSKCPALVIAFYEGKRAWLASPDLGDQEQVQSSREVPPTSTPAGSRPGPKSRKLQLKTKADEVEEDHKRKGDEKGAMASLSKRAKRVPRRQAGPPEASTSKFKDEDSETVKPCTSEEGEGSSEDSEVEEIPMKKRRGNSSYSSNGSNDSNATVDVPVDVVELE